RGGPLRLGRRPGRVRRGAGHRRRRPGRQVPHPVRLRGPRPPPGRGPPPECQHRDEGALAMPHEFELRKEITLEATPEQVWEAIPPGPGIATGFRGPNQGDPRGGGRPSMTIGAYTDEGTVTAWDPPSRFALQS